MDDSEDLLPEDDSVFEALVNDSLNVSSDAILEDSFSSLPDTNTSVLFTSTPLVKGPGRVRGQGTSRTQTRRGFNPLAAGGALPDSPVRMTQSSSRSRTPVPSDTASPDRHADSPSRGTRSRSHTVEASNSPPHSTTASPSRRTRSEPQTALQTAQRGQAKGRGAHRLKCPMCPSTFANDRTLGVHKRKHSLKRAFAKAAGPEEFLEKLPMLLVSSMNIILEEAFVGKWAASLKTYTRQVKATFDQPGEDHDFLFAFLHENLYIILKDHSSVFVTSLSSTFYLGVNSLMNSCSFRENLKKHVVALGDVEAPSMEVLNIFIGSFMLHLSSEVLIYFIRSIHGATANDEIRRKRSGDKIDSHTFLEMAYYIGGSVVHGFLFKGNKFKETNSKWKLFVDVLYSKFCRVEAVGNACAPDVRRYTEAVDRGKLKHLSQEALDFFVVLFDFLMSLEGEDGSLPVNVVDEYVLKNDTIICLWDILVGSELDDDASLDFLMQMSDTCKLIVMKGILKRRLNERLKKAYAAVSLRSRLAE